MRVSLICLILLCVSISLRAADEPFTLSADEQAIVNFTNAERQKAGKKPLRPHPILFSVARKHAEDMAAAQKLEHRLNGKNSSDRVQAAGYNWTMVSENIAWNQRSVDEVMNGWMHSAGHRTNLLASEIVDIGVGVATNSAGEPYWVQVFAKPEVEEATRSPVAQRPPLAQLVRPAPIDNTFSFSIQNVSGETMSVDVHTNNPYVIQPGETFQYTLVAPSAKPSVELKSSTSALEFIVKNGAKYTINANGDELELTQKNSVAPR